MKKFPVQKNELFHGVHITDLGEGGTGIGHIALETEHTEEGSPCQQYTLFVRHALPGDVVTVRITKAKSHYAFGRIESLDAPSLHRVPSPCPCSKRCGACQLLELSYEAQLAFKRKRITDALKRIGGFSEAEILHAANAAGNRQLQNGSDAIEILPSLPFRCRNKAQYPVSSKENILSAGFYSLHSHEVVDIKDCLLTPPVFSDIKNIILEHCMAYHVSAYEETSGKGLLRHILIRQGFHSKEIQVLLVINGKKFPHGDKLADKLSGIQSLKILSISENRENTNVILGKTFRTIYGSPYIRDSLSVNGNTLHFDISPLSFYQVNTHQAEQLYEKVLAYAALQGNEQVWDLYCGIGTISLFLAKQAKNVIGIEENLEAVRDAERNAVLNNITNTAFLAGKAEELLEAQSRQSVPDLVVVDPPRAGLAEKVIQIINTISLPKIVYVSCNPSTLARDLKLFCKEGGYRLEEICGADMFPQSEHVETVCLLSNRKPDTKVRIDVDLEDYYRIKDSKKNQN